ncbi:hypothetical protein EVAR_31195_1 [Eumeta japonica]|uniref:Uncharacterized protein n=1 Tax=Eumeta variegata TaxID=151549 RepID=A0A4C1VWV5_EUMVA|nr:hypothetical protein EVAR_31195_1 [Eumeta japonica]
MTLYEAPDIQIFNTRWPTQLPNVALIQHPGCPNKSRFSPALSLDQYGVQQSSGQFAFSRCVNLPELIEFAEGSNHDAPGSRGRHRAAGAPRAADGPAHVPRVPNYHINSRRCGRLREFLRLLLLEYTYKCRTDLIRRASSRRPRHRASAQDNHEYSVVGDQAAALSLCRDL